MLRQYYDNLGQEGKRQVWEGFKIVLGGCAKPTLYLRLDSQNPTVKEVAVFYLLGILTAEEIGAEFGAMASLLRQDLKVLDKVGFRKVGLIPQSATAGIPQAVVNFHKN